ncbi:cytochrome b5-related protein-like isoform X1 [Lycorma delicatula]|uniref:cytochrome b5-related protein-like isoform X1 n=1 Tax=Lycorma delicatula TaxID=130591 RepID=UPI003F51634E
MTPIKLSWPDWKYPEWIDEGYRTTRGWLEKKKRDDGAEGLWRIHNGLYDLTTWVDKHPGGKLWIKMTQGLDVTEIFEASHLSPSAEKILPTFFVREARISRNSPYTFHPGGFFRTLKRRVYEKTKNIKRGPSKRAIVLIDLFVVITLLLSIISAKYFNFYIGALTGIFLTGTTILAHNLFHQRDNWRMYYFQLSLMSVTDWRISHALSHHIYTNTRLDLEILLMEPLLQWFPKEQKNWIVKYGSWIYSPLFYCSLYFLQAFSRIICHGLEPEDLICIALPTTMYLFSGSNLLICIISWLWIITFSSFIFGVIGFNVAHHHPDIFHEGDKPRNDKDWGLNQIDAVNDRIEVAATFPWAHLSFGDHTLHHMFPTLDHDILSELYPVFEKTCLEFGVEFRFNTTWNLFKGQFHQLTRTLPNTVPRENITAPLKS